jgi:NADP-dependent 3-hydroxy acid dehydrogenase YdfG
MGITTSAVPVILITGADNGIGLSLTKALVNMSYRIACLDLSCENLEPLREVYAESILCYPCDLTYDSEVKETVGMVVSHWNRIDVLVNNACLANYQLYEECSLDSIRQ